MDLHHLNVDPDSDSAFHFDVDLDPACHFDADPDPDPACHIHADSILPLTFMRIRIPSSK